MCAIDVGNIQSIRNCMRLLLIISLSLLTTLVSAQQRDTLSWDAGEVKKYEIKERLSGFSLNGYYRFFGLHRNLESPFVVLPNNVFANTPPVVFGAGDVYRDPPICLMTASVRPGGGASINMDYAMYSNFTGNSGNVPYNLNLGVSLYGSVPTKFANVGFQLGGINWVDVSDMLFSSFVGYNRFSLYERWPWEDVGQAADRAEFFLQNGDIAREDRWARQAFKGALFDFTELPGGLSARVMVGTTPATGNFGSILPGYTTGGRLRKTFNEHTVSFNTMNYILTNDSITDEKSGLQLHTVSGDFKWGDWNLRGEIGAAESYTYESKGDWGEAIRLNVRRNKILPWLDAEIELFRLAPEFVNFYGNFLSAGQRLTPVAIDQSGSGLAGATFAGSVTDVGQIVNNREGFSLNLFTKHKSTAISFGTMISRELESLSNKLSFGHKINGQTMSRFAPFASGVGPYARWNSFYRGVSEDIFITETDDAGIPLSRLHFHTTQLQVKQSLKYKNHPFYIIYTGMIGSVSPDLAIIPRTNSTAFLITQYHEFDFITPLFDGLDLTLSYGNESFRGNSKTNNIYYVDENGQTAGASVDYVAGASFDDYDLEGTQIAAANYEGAARPIIGNLRQQSERFGIGLDVDLSPNSGLYIRHKRFYQQDLNFSMDDIRGTETTLELKIFF